MKKLWSKIYPLTILVLPIGAILYISNHEVDGLIKGMLYVLSVGWIIGVTDEMYNLHR